MPTRTQKQQLPKVDIAAIMPIVMVRDPYFWMQAMCRNPYAATGFERSNHFPKLVKKKDAENGKPVHLDYGNDMNVSFDSLAHMWQGWNEQYYNATHILD